MFQRPTPECGDVIQLLQLLEFFSTFLSGRPFIKHGDQLSQMNLLN